jgi:2Fe-2S ferredoxin
MVKVTYIDSNDDSRTIDVDIGLSVMAGAKSNDIPEIAYECGGVCTCSTCQVYVEPEWFDKLEPMSKIETGLLSLQESRRPNSRLSCQIKLVNELDGIVVRTLKPEDNEEE